MKSTFRYEDYSHQYIAGLERAVAATMPEVAAAMEAEGINAAQSLIYAKPESKSYQRTGNLINAITHEYTEDTAVAECDVDYAFYVHEGTRYMSARPFLKVALEKEIGRFHARLKRRMP